MNRKVVFLDIDGTIVNYKGKTGKGLRSLACYLYWKK